MRTTPDDDSLASERMPTRDMPRAQATPDFDANPNTMRQDNTQTAADTRRYRYTAMIEILANPDALLQLTADLKLETRLRCWTYLLDEPFARRLFAQDNHSYDIKIIADHRQRATLAALARWVPHFSARTWSTNRSMHDKTFLLLDTGLTYIGTHNLTRGSYTMSSNRVVRIASYPATQRLNAEWIHDWQHARPVPPTPNL